MTMLDPRAREAARLWATEAASDGGIPGDDYIDGILTAYLSTVTPAEVGGHADAQTEARAIVVQVVHEVNGDKPGGHQRAADIIATALAAKDAELALAIAERNFWREAAARDQAQLAEARKALEWHPIETAPLNTIVDLWCTYADAPASWGNDRPAGQIVHNRHKSKEHGWFGNESNDGIPQANGPDLVPVAWRWPAPEIPLEMMERFVAARRALEAQGGENG